jgi:hypothetical protein
MALLLNLNIDESVWTVLLRCSFFKGEIKSVKVVRSCGNKKFDQQAVSETKGKHVPEVAFGTQRHEYWRTMTWTMPKGAPYGEPRLPPKLAEPNVLVGVPFAAVCSVTSPILDTTPSLSARADISPTAQGQTNTA